MIKYSKRIQKFPLQKFTNRPQLTILSYNQQEFVIKIHHLSPRIQQVLKFRISFLKKNLCQINCKRRLIKNQQIIYLRSIIQQISEYQLQVLSPQLIYPIVMNFPESQVKLEAAEEYNDSRIAQVGPFRIQRVDNPLKPFYRPVPADWSNFENAKYAAFLLYHLKKFENASNSHLWGMYKEMSQFISTRNFRQCKAHHSRHIILFFTIPRIVDYLLTNIPKFDRLLSIQSENLENLYTSKKLPISVNFEHQGSFNPEDISKLFPTKETVYNTSDEYIPQSKPHFSDEHRQLPQLNFLPLGAFTNEEKAKQKEWVQCHQLFVQWTMKIRQLQILSLQL